MERPGRWRVRRLASSARRRERKARSASFVASSRARSYAARASSSRPRAAAGPRARSGRGGSARAAGPSSSSRPAAGPSAIATATARFSSTTGDGCTPRELAVERRDLAPVGVLGARPPARAAPRSPPGAGTARAARSASARSSSATPRVDQVAVPQRRGPGPRAGRASPSGPMRACVRDAWRSSSASSPSTSGSSGISAARIAAEPDRLRHQVGPRQIVAGRRAVALVEDQVDDGERGVEPVGQQVVRRHAIRDARGADLPLRAHEPLRERLLRHEERARDLRRREPADEPQRQRDLRVRRERRMAAREEEREPLVGDRRLVVHRFLRLRRARPRARARRRSRRSRSIAFRRAVTVSHAPGLSGTPVRGHVTSAAPSASWSASSARSMSRRSLISVATTRPYSARKTASRGATSSRPDAPRSSRSRLRGSSRRTRAPRRGSRSRGRSSRRAAPSSPRTARR